MKQVFLSTTTEFKEIDTLEPGTWINLVNPTQNESLEIANFYKYTNRYHKRIGILVLFAF